MTNEDLTKAKKLIKEIDELEKFIYHAGKVWTGKIVKRTSKYIFWSNPYGIFNEAEYSLDTEMKNKVLDVLRERLLELKKEFENI